MIRLIFNEYEIELENDKSFDINSDAQIYDFIFYDKEAIYCRSSMHGIRIYKDGLIYKSAVVCAVAGATGIHDNSAIVVENDLLICCADKIFSLQIPELNLNWMKQCDPVCCFQIFKNEHGIFVHGEMHVSSLDTAGNIIWEVGFMDITVTPDGTDDFVMHEDFIAVKDWSGNKYKIDFQGNFI